MTDAQRAARGARRPAVEGDALESMLVGTSTPTGGARPTPAEGWDVATSVAHLAWTDEVAVLAATDKAAWDDVVLQAMADPDGFVDAEALAAGARAAAGAARRWRVGPASPGRGARRAPPATGCRGSARRCAPTSMATARYMETWAHGLDVADALDVPVEPARPGASRGPHRCPHARLLLRQPRPRRARRRRPGRAGRAQRASPWSTAPDDAEQRVTGSAWDFALLVTQRRHRADLDLSPTGADADRVARHRAGLRRAPRQRTRPAGTPVTTTGVLRVGNCSGFYGDRLSAMREMLEGGELDVLTGDYLAELTMLILGRDQMKDPALGYARTFLTQLERLPRARPGAGRADRRQRRRPQPVGAGRPARARSPPGRGWTSPVAYVDGDDLVDRAAELGLDRRRQAAHRERLPRRLRHRRALAAGADVVVTGRVTDASVVVGPAVAHFGWGRDDHDELAGAVVAGHVIECGAQATGGNFSGFRALLDSGRADAPLGFPLAEIAADGSS